MVLGNRDKPILHLAARCGATIYGDRVILTHEQLASFYYAALAGAQKNREAERKNGPPAKE